MEGAETPQAAWIGVTEDRLDKLERFQQQSERETKRLKQDLQALRSLHLLSSSNYTVFSDNAEVKWYLNRGPEWKRGDFLRVYSVACLATPSRQRQGFETASDSRPSCRPELQGKKGAEHTMSLAHRKGNVAPSGFDVRMAGDDRVFTLGEPDKRLTIGRVFDDTVEWLDHEDRRESLFHEQHMWIYEGMTRPANGIAVMQFRANTEYHSETDTA